jgi:hypothetical protein
LLQSASAGGAVLSLTRLSRTARGLNGVDCCRLSAPASLRRPPEGFYKRVYDRSGLDILVNHGGDAASIVCLPVLSSTPTGFHPLDVGLNYRVGDSPNQLPKRYGPSPHVVTQSPAPIRFAGTKRVSGIASAPATSPLSCRSTTTKRASRTTKKP